MPRRHLRSWRDVSETARRLTCAPAVWSTVDRQECDYHQEAGMCNDLQGEHPTAQLVWRTWGSSGFVSREGEMLNERVGLVKMST